MPDAELKLRRVALAGAALAACIATAITFAVLLAKHQNGAAGGLQLQRSYSLVVSGAPLLTAPQLDQQAYAAQMDRQLHGLGWADDGQGRVHIPIEQAMAQLAASSASAPGRRP